MRIIPEPAKALSAQQECEIVRGALARKPGSATLRLRLAKLLNQLDAFAETIALLETAVSGCDEGLALAAAYFGRDAPGDAARAYAATLEAAAMAATDGERAAALAEQAKALLRMDRAEPALAALWEALRLDPANRNACRRLATELLRKGDAAGVIALTDRLGAQGVGHARIFAARMLAFAHLRRVDEARATIDMAELGHRGTLAVPAGWSDIAGFNGALADELRSHPGVRFERHGTASRRTWRIDSLATGAAPVARTLLDLLAWTAERHVAALTDRVHPWCGAQPSAGVLRSWCVMTEGEGFERWHAHPAGWLSGVYYVQVPDAVVSGTDTAGCIVFGAPDGLIGAQAAQAFGQDVVRPHPGLLMLFPSHAYHRTFPHRGEGQRMCVSFDIVPA